MRLTCTGKPLGEKGFSLIELLVSIAIVAIVIIALSVTFERSGRLYTTQNVSAALQEEVRAAVEIMARELRMVGYNPTRSAKFDMDQFLFNSTHVRFHKDIDEDGDVATTGYPDCERLSFRYSTAREAVDMICREGMGGQDVQTLIGGTDSDTRVTSLTFDYRKEDDTSTSFNNDIRSVLITLVAEAPAGRDGMIQRSYSTRVEFRNAAPNAIN